MATGFLRSRIGWARWCTPFISAHWRQRQDEANLVYIVNSQTVRAILAGEALSQKQKIDSELKERWKSNAADVCVCLERRV